MEEVGWRGYGGGGVEGVWRRWGGGGMEEVGWRGYGGGGVEGVRRPSSRIIILSSKGTITKTLTY